MILSVSINAYQYQDLDDNAKKEVIYWLDNDPQEYEKEDGTFGYSYYCDLSNEDEHIIIEFCDMNNYKFDKYGNPIHQLIL
jgi:quinol monooxygenase YgiN